MKVCIFDIKRFAVHDGPGIRTTVFFKGCPLDCRWCHNPEGISGDIERFTETVELDGVRLEKETEVGRYVEVEGLMEELLRDRIFMEESGGGISFSGGEPLQQSDALFRLLELASEQNIHTTVDTSGYARGEVVEKLATLTDLILYDLKTMDEEKHLQYTGISNRRITENLGKALNGTAEVIVRIPLVGGFNDSDEDVDSLLDFLKGLNRLRAVDILPYHAYGSHKYNRLRKENRQNGFKTPSDRRLEEIRRRFEGAGFRAGIGG